MSRANETRQVTEAVEQALSYAKAAGADAAATASIDDGQTVACRMQELETLEFHRSQQLSISVFKNQCKGSASTSDLSSRAIQETVNAALQIARFTSEDKCTGLADADLMATEIDDMDLYHPAEHSAEDAIATVLACEKTALDFDNRIDNSEGASYTGSTGTGAYGNTHGFISAKSGTSFSLSCCVISKDDAGMQRDYWYSSERKLDQLESPADIGRKAAERAIRRLSPRKLSTRESSVLFSADIAKTLVGHLFSALSGRAIYREASFLLNQVGKPLLPDGVDIWEEPHLKLGHNSSSYDREGVATRQSKIIEDGRISRYLLSSYSARRLGLETTANAGGTRNVRLTHGDKSLDEMLKTMDTGLFATELIGSSVNIVNGDYSRGVSGFWVENGEIVYPVEELTIAGNLKDIYAGLLEIGGDIDQRGNVHTGSWLLDKLTIAGS